MKSLVAALFFAFFCLPALADTPAPWTKAQAVLNATQADLQRSGLRGVASHVEDIEKALDDGAVCFPYYDSGSGDIIALTSGLLDTMTALSGASAKQKEGKLRSASVVAVANPYPILTLYLGSYYNEIGRFDDAARVLGKGLTMFASGNFGETVPYLTSEHALALARGGHLDEALAAYDIGLKLPAIDNKGKARLHRGRGYVFTEMNRLDEAEAAYNDSLKLEPGNQVALGELDYIAKLRHGGSKAPGDIVLPNQQPKK